MVEKVNVMQDMSALDMEQIRNEQEKKRKEEIKQQKLELLKEKKLLI